MVKYSRKLVELFETILSSWSQATLITVSSSLQNNSIAFWRFSGVTSQKNGKWRLLEQTAFSWSQFSLRPDLVSRENTMISLWHVWLSRSPTPVSKPREHLCAHYPTRISLKGTNTKHFLSSITVIVVVFFAIIVFVVVANFTHEFSPNCKRAIQLSEVNCKNFACSFAKF